MKLLVADDSATIQKIIRLTFASDEIQIETSASGESLLEKLRNEPPALLMLDIFLPGCNSYEVCAQIKADPDLSGIAVILLAGAFEPFDEMEAARAKADAHLLKPFDTSELVKLVQTLAGDQWPAAAATDSGSEAGSGVKAPDRPAKSALSAHAWDSFVGPNRILDLWDQDALSRAESVRLIARGLPETNGNALEVSDPMVDRIVEKVVRRMSQEVIREVAWEVVPDLSEILIKQQIKENHKSGS